MSLALSPSLEAVLEPQYKPPNPLWPAGRALQVPEGQIPFQKDQEALGWTRRPQGELTLTRREQFLHNAPVSYQSRKGKFKVCPPLTILTAILSFSFHSLAASNIFPFAG